MVGRALWPMSTARGVALLRAIEMQRPPGERISVDPYAARFVDPLTRHATRAMMASGLSSLLGLEGMMNFAILRERYVADLMAREVASGVSQIVVLGAGFDTRAYRLERAGAVRVFEVDHPSTQRAKHRALHGVVVPPDNVAFVAVDFDHDDLGERLRTEGYDPSRRTLFVWQGVVMYLSDDGIDRTLAFIARNSSPGSVLVFDYMYARLLRRLDGPSPLGVMTRAMGERMTFGLDPEQVRPFLTQRGFTDVVTVDGEALKALYVAGPRARRPVEADAAIATARVAGDAGKD